VLVVEDDQQRFLPLGAGGQRVVDGEDEFLAVFDVGGGVIVVGLEASSPPMGEHPAAPGRSLLVQLAFAG
jgi:hypothetical protein